MWFSKANKVEKYIGRIVQSYVEYLLNYGLFGSLEREESRGEWRGGE